MHDHLPATNAAPNYFAALSLTDARRRLVWSPAVPHQRSITHDVLLSCTTPWTVGHAQKSRCVRASDSISASSILTEMRERSKSRRDERQLQYRLYAYTSQPGSLPIIINTVANIHRCSQSGNCNPCPIKKRSSLLIFLFFFQSSFFSSFMLCVFLFHSKSKWLNKGCHQEMDTKTSETGKVVRRMVVEDWWAVKWRGEKRNKHDDQDPQEKDLYNQRKVVQRRYSLGYLVDVLLEMVRWIRSTTTSDGDDERPACAVDCSENLKENWAKLATHDWLAFNTITLVDDSRREWKRKWVCRHT